MVSKSEPSNALRETLSSLMDGELPSEAVRLPCSQWRVEAQARETWHTYHLIGDVLRSDDLASHSVRDEAFLRRLRGRLAQEPVPMAPLPAAAPATPATRPADAAAVVALTPAAVPARRRSASRRFAPLAMAASVVAVAGVVGVMRVSSTAPGVVETAQLAPGSGVYTGLADAGPSGVTPVTMLRDARVDRYMAAHRKLANGIAVPDRAGYQFQAVYESK